MITIPQSEAEKEKILAEEKRLAEIQKKEEEE